jgi:hypothetical protein
MLSMSASGLQENSRLSCQIAVTDELDGLVVQMLEFGTRHYIDRLTDGMYRDYSTRNGKLPATGGELKVHEFDYRSRQFVYD